MIKQIQKLPKSFFEEYHKKFKGDTYHTCQTCGGCEYSLIASFLPGETDYIAEKLNMSESDFRKKFLDEVKVEKITIDVVRMVIPCLWLNDKGHCLIRDFKLVLCDIYPLAIKIDNDKVSVEMDKWCPLYDVNENKFMQNWKDIEELFQQLPIEFIDALDKFECRNYDVVKLENIRGVSKEQVAIIDYKDILKCVIDINAYEATKKFCETNI